MLLETDVQDEGGRRVMSETSSEVPASLAWPNGLRPQRRDDLSSVELDGEAVILDESSSELHHLNQSAAFVLALCDGSRTVEELVSELAATFAMPTAVMAAELDRALASLTEAHLLVEASPDPRTYDA
jgi:hypothetical protein